MRNRAPPHPDHARRRRERLRSALGLALAGAVQPVDPDVPRGHCDIVLALLPDGERRGISVDLPPEVPGCRLDPEALEAAVARRRRRRKPAASVTPEDVIPHSRSAWLL
ncbi:hypothetical protein DPM13_16375 [Paracoccus mutanolyticus]|uniref:Uncharacterized protein n=1 Tax=Paracoccus mutanolyticus TaxID=1499308 RepID=A0ABM6WV56_9RHOB|nr:DUF2478 domain-containing protein [Paracoccus mutanolyticus]AWX94529.1 hypothetical protein DPM13_16375 [Paracoccus mutanolyticus]